MSKFLFGAVLLATALAPPLRAGDATADTAAFMQRSTADLVGLTDDEGTPVGLGAAYKIYFRAASAEFVPALGPRFAYNLPVGLQFLSVSRGDDLLAGTYAGSEPVGDEVGATVRYDRGAGVTELWQMRPEGAELSFLLDAVPPGTGDLVVRLRLATELRDVESTDGGLRLTAPAPDGNGEAGVFVGRVEGRDALGRRASGAVRLAGDVLELSLPDSFLHEARAPIVLDPLVGPVMSISNFKIFQEMIRAAYDASYARWLVVWTRAYSANDYDILGVLLNYEGVATGGLLGVETSLKHDDQADVCSINLRNRFLVVWGRIDVSGGDIFVGRTVNPSDGSLGQQGTVVGLAPQPAIAHEAQLGGNTTLVDDRCLLAFRRGVPGAAPLSVASLRVPASGPPVGDPPKTIEPTYGEYALSRSGGANNDFLLVWATPTALWGTMRDVFGNSIIGPTVLSPTQSSNGIHDLSVDGDGSRFAVVYGEDFLAVPGNESVKALRVEYNGPTFAIGPKLSLATSQYNWESVAWTGAAFQVAAVEIPAAGPTAIRAGGIAPLAFQVYDPFVQVNDVPGFDDLDIASQQAGTGLKAETGLLTWFNSNSDATWQTIQSHGAGGSVVDLGGGCGLGGQLLNAGLPALGNPAFNLVVLGADPTAATVYFNFNLPGTQIGCGSCVFLPVAYFVGVPSSSGFAVLTIPLSAEPSWAGITVQAQVIVLTPSSSPCPSLPKASFSNRLQITLN